ncbi:MAG: hypothetical protein Q8S00_13050 [Deltaproteobacteria bacterium]|nr:hypothetical protein [Deltaproteobacteria bacterium]
MRSEKGDGSKGQKGLPDPFSGPGSKQKSRMSLFLSQTTMKNLAVTKLCLGIFNTVIFIAVGCLPAFSASVPNFNPTHTKILALSEAKRSELFTMWAKGENCGSVTRTFFQGQSQDGTAFWSIQCSNRMVYQVAVYNDKNGSTRVLDCGTLKVIAKLDCFTKY